MICPILFSLYHPHNQNFADLYSIFIIPYNKHKVKLLCSQFQPMSNAPKKFLAVAAGGG